MTFYLKIDIKSFKKDEADYVLGVLKGRVHSVVSLFVVVWPNVCCPSSKLS